jgi:hypothetical protein
VFLPSKSAADKKICTRLNWKKMQKIDPAFFYYQDLLAHLTEFFSLKRSPGDRNDFRFLVVEK